MITNQSDNINLFWFKEDNGDYSDSANNNERLLKIKVSGEMAAAIAHEIRNPMTTVRGMLQILEGKPQYLDFAESFNMMIKELDKANAIITEVLLLASTKATNLELKNLNEVVKEVLQTVTSEATAMKKKVVVQLGVVPDLLLNRQEIKKLILNMSRNGLEAMQSQGVLMLKTFTDGTEVVLAIEDQGKGIELGLLDMLGVPFFTTKDEGTGLGLAVCYSIAAKHNAIIKAETSPSGTTFLIRFPIGARTSKIDEYNTI